MRQWPSITARWVAAQRSRLERPHTSAGEPDAEHRLYQGVGRALLLLPGMGDRRMAARTRWFDDETMDAIERGVGQIVIVGAGYDGRALRFRSPGVSWIEVDHPSTQQDKRRRVEGLDTSLDDVTFVALDLTSGNLDQALAAAGHDKAAATLFLCEGLLGYLPRPTIGALLDTLRQRAAAGSTVAANFRVNDDGPVQAPARVNRLLMDALLKFIGERRATEFDAADPENLLAAAGWRVVRGSTSDDRSADRSRGVLVAAEPV